MTNNELPRTRAWPTGQREIVRARVAAHRAADEIIQGSGWDGVRGCAIGCSLDRYDHAEYARVVLGDSAHGRLVAVLIDDIHEALPREAALKWPERIVDALAEGADTTLLLRRWLHWLLSEHLEVYSVARPMSALMARSLAGDEPASEEWEAAARAAKAAWGEWNSVRAERGVAWATWSDWDIWEACAAQTAWYAWRAWRARRARKTKAVKEDAAWAGAVWNVKNWDSCAARNDWAAWYAWAAWDFLPDRTSSAQYMAKALIAIMRSLPAAE